MQLVCTGFTTSRAGTIIYWKTHHKYEPGWNLSINHAGSGVPTFKLKNRVEASPEANTAPTRQKRSRDLEQTHSFLTWGDGSWLRCCIHEKRSQRPLESSLRSQPDFRPHHLLTFSHLFSTLVTSSHSFWSSQIKKWFVATWVSAPKSDLRAKAKEGRLWSTS